MADKKRAGSSLSAFNANQRKQLEAMGYIEPPKPKPKKKAAAAKKGYRGGRR